MFFSEHRLKMTSLRIGKHRIVKNIASLRKVNIAHPYPGHSCFVEKFKISNINGKNDFNTFEAI